VRAVAGIPGPAGTWENSGSVVSDQLQRQVVQPALQRPGGGIQILHGEGGVQRTAVVQAAVQHRH